MNEVEGELQEETPVALSPLIRSIEGFAKLYTAYYRAQTGYMDSLKEAASEEKLNALWMQESGSPKSFLQHLRAYYYEFAPDHRKLQLMRWRQVLERAEEAKEKAQAWRKAVNEGFPFDYAVPGSLSHQLTAEPIDECQARLGTIRISRQTPSGPRFVSRQVYDDANPAPLDLIRLRLYGHSLLRDEEKERLNIAIAGWGASRVKMRGTKQRLNKGWHVWDRSYEELLFQVQDLIAILIHGAADSTEADSSQWQLLLPPIAPIRDVESDAEADAVEALWQTELAPRSRAWCDIFGRQLMNRVDRHHDRAKKFEQTEKIVASLPKDQGSHEDTNPGDIFDKYGEPSPAASTFLEELSQRELKRQILAAQSEQLTPQEREAWRLKAQGLQGLLSVDIQQKIGLTKRKYANFLARNHSHLLAEFRQAEMRIRGVSSKAKQTKPRAKRPPKPNAGESTKPDCKRIPDHG